MYADVKFEFMNWNCIIYSAQGTKEIKDSMGLKFSIQSTNILLSTCLTFIIFYFDKWFKLNLLKSLVVGALK